MTSLSQSERWMWRAVWSLEVVAYALLVFGILHRHDTRGGLGSLAFWLFFGSFSAAIIGFGFAAGAGE